MASGSWQADAQLDGAVEGGEQIGGHKRLLVGDVDVQVGRDGSVETTEHTCPGWSSAGASWCTGASRLRRSR